MRSILTSLVTATMISVAGPALANPADAAQKSKQVASEKKVCRLLETTGTRMSERVCLTEREWLKVDRESR